MICVSVVDIEDARKDLGLRETAPELVEIDLPVFVDVEILKEIDGFFKGVLEVDTAGTGDYETLFIVQS